MRGSDGFEYPPYGTRMSCAQMDATFLFERVKELEAELGNHARYMAAYRKGFTEVLKEDRQQARTLIRKCIRRAGSRGLPAYLLDDLRAFLDGKI